MLAPLNDHSPQDGLHKLKDVWYQKSYMKEQCVQLSDNMKEVINATKEAAPSRTQGYALKRSATKNIDSTQRERQWEKSIFERWSESGLSPVTGCWNRIVAFQVPLFQEEKKDSWGYIDLLGVDNNGSPVVIELKKEPKTKRSGGTDNTETPLRMVLEAAAYAIAIQKNWNNFRGEFIECLKSLSVSDKIIEKVPVELKQVPLVCAAPASFWIDWLPVTAKGKKVSKDTWTAFSTLLNAFSKDYPISFVSISGDIAIPGSLAAQPLESFPIIVD